MKEILVNAEQIARLEAHYFRRRAEWQAALAAGTTEAQRIVKLLEHNSALCRAAREQDHHE
jgi:hypothetical protein